MRLFLAIELDEAARRAIATEQQRLNNAIEHDGRSLPKWVRPEHMHLTLAFLGDVDAQRTDTLVNTMREAMPYQRFAIELGGLGVFPARGAPRVLWLGLRHGGTDVVEVQRLVVERLARLGIELERRPFHPHLTLARWRVSETTDRDGAAKVDRHAVVARIHVQAVTLVHSRLSPEGPRYSTLCEARLADWPPQPLESS